MTDSFHIRTMTPTDLDIAVVWAQQEGWNPGRCDSQCFYPTDPHGFFMGFIDNQPVASISAVAYNNRFGFIGFYIVSPKYRGRGYGLKIWQYALTYLDHRNIGLDGVVAQQENYTKSGFTFAYNHIRYQYTPVILGNPVSRRTPESKTKEYTSGNILQLNKVPFPDVLAYDSQLFPAPRPQFLKCWITQPGHISLGYIHNGKLAGYGIIRPCVKGYKIGPLFANNETIAEKLFSALSNSVPVNSVTFLDIPQPNHAAVKLAQKYHLTPVFETARMYTQEIPAIDVNKIFGVTSFELG